MRRTLMVVLFSLSACGQGSKADQAARTEQVEIAACRTTYPVGSHGLFGSLVRCEMGAVSNYIQMVDPAENREQARLATELESQADAVDSGRMTVKQWQAQASDAVHSLKNSKRTVEATSEIL